MSVNSSSILERNTTYFMIIKIVIIVEYVSHLKSDINWVPNLQNLVRNHRVPRYLVQKVSMIFKALSYR